MYTIPTTLQTALTNKTPQRVLIEFANKTFSNEKVAVSSGVELDETFQSADDFTVGGTPSAEIQFTLINENSELNNFAFGKFTAWLGARIDSGTPGSGAKTKNFTEGGVSRLYEFTPLGTFIAERPNVVNIKAISITANDQMQLFDTDMPSDSALNLTYPCTMATLYVKMCAYLGVSYVTSTFTNSNLTVSSRPKAFNNATMRDVLGWIAEAAGCVARFNRNGKLAMTWFNSINKTYTESNYSDFTPYWYETTAVNGLSVRNGSNEHVTGSGSNKYLIKDNPFLTGNNQSTYETAVYNKLNAAPTFHPASASLFENWNIEAGDVVTVQNEGTNYSVPMYNVHIRWTGDTKVDTESTGNKKRDALPEVEKKYYSGGVGARTFADEQQGWYVSIADDVNSVRADLAVTASSIIGRVEDAEGELAELTITANSIRAEVENARSEYAAFVIEANQIRSRVGDAEENITTLQQTSSTISAWVEGAESRISELELSQSGLIVTVGKKNTTYRQWYDPRTSQGGSHDVIPGDRWIKTKGINKWNDVQTQTWTDVNNLPWKDAAGPEEYIWTGSEWRLINDYGSDVLLGAQFSVLDDRITGIVRDVDGRTSQIEQTANYIKSTVTDTKNGLSSMILQEASQIRSEVTDSVCGLQSSITQNADRIALVVNTSDNSIKAAQIVSAINNSGSSVLISADKVYLDGTTTVAGCLSVNGGTLYVDKLSYFNDNVTVASSKTLSTGTLRIVGGGQGEYYDLNSSKVGNLITELDVASSNNVYYLRKKTVYDSSQWTDVASFNRGTTPVLSGAWSGATYTVTATGATPVSTNVMYKPAGDGQHTNFSVETYHDNLNVAGNKVLTEYVHLTEDVSAKYVYGRWGSSTGTAYARVSTAETYQAGYNTGANATVSISGSWNTSNATFTATALPGTNKTVSTQVFLVPDGDGQSNNFSVYTTHTAGNTSAVKLRTEHVYVTEDVTNKYAYARWASTTGTAYARVSTASTYRAGQTSVTLSESWSNGGYTGTGSYSVTASSPNTQSKSHTFGLVAAGSGQTNNFTVTAYRDSTANALASKYVYMTEDVANKRVTGYMGDTISSGSPWANVSTAATFNAGREDVSISGSWCTTTGAYTVSIDNSKSNLNTSVHIAGSMASGVTDPTTSFRVYVYDDGNTSNALVTRSVYLTKSVSLKRVNARLGSTSATIIGRMDVSDIYEDGFSEGEDSVTMQSAWEIIGANNACRHVELSNSKSNNTYIHVAASQDASAAEAVSGYVNHFPLWVYYGSSTSNVLITREVYLTESVTNKWVNARWNGSSGNIYARVSTEATYNSVTLSAAWSGNTYTVTPSNNKSPKSTTIGLTGDGQNESFTVSAYHDSSSANKVASMNGYLVVTTSSTRNDNKAEVRLIAKTGTTSLLVSSQTLGDVYDAGYTVTTSQFSTNVAPYIGNGQAAGYSGSENLGSLSKTNIQANAYIFFTVRVHGTNKKYRITVNP